MFWDASALVPTLIPAPESASLISILTADRDPTVWWGSPLECQSAIYRREREARLPVRFRDEGLHRLAMLMEDADIVEPTLGLRDRAGRLLATHPLRAGDALQLAAALVWCGDAPYQTAFICLDGRLRDAARAEGFDLLPA
jgi:predicted nucleic acid-binding protein